MPLPEDWRGFIESLNLSGVEYLIVGAVALAHHGFPRYAGALDVFVRNTPENAQRLEAALGQFGFGSVGLKAADFVNSYQVIQLGVAPNRVVLLTSLTSVTFDDAWAGRVEGDLGGIRANFIGRQTLIENKQATGRPQDHADLDALREDS